MRPWSDVHIRTENAIMVDGRACVDDASNPCNRIWSNDGSREYDGSLTERGSSSTLCRRMKDRGDHEPSAVQSLHGGLACRRISNACERVTDAVCINGRECRCITQDGIFKKLSRRCVIDESDDRKCSGALDAVGHYFSLAACAIEHNGREGIHPRRIRVLLIRWNILYAAYCSKCSKIWAIFSADRPSP